MSMRFIYICHPYGGDYRNLERAHERCMRMRWDDPEIVPVYVPLMFHWMLDDGDPKSREAGLAFCLRTLEHCAEVRVLGDRITEGMAREIEEAKRLGIPVIYPEGVSP